jgi:hypothetical protein
MEEYNRDIMLSIKDNVMKKKQLDMRGYGLINTLGYVRVEEPIGREVDKQEFLDLCVKEMKVTRRKARTILNVFIETGLVDEFDKNTIIVYPIGADGWFVKLKLRTVRFCANALSSNAFKVYCYLFNKYRNNCRKGKDTTFSQNELLEAIGYNDTYGNNHTLVADILDVLTKTNLITVNKNKKRVGMGTFYILDSVNQYEGNEYEPTIGDMIEKVEKPIETKTLDRMVFELNHFNDYFVVEDGWGRTLAKYVRKYNIGEDVWKEAIKESLFHDSYIEETEKVLGAHGC